MKTLSPSPLFAVFFVIFSVFLLRGLVPQAEAAERFSFFSRFRKPPSGQGPYSAGLKILDLQYQRTDGKKETVTVAVWYPTNEKPRSYTYSANNYEGMVAINAEVVRSEPHPLVIFIHGGFSSGYGSAYFSEHLARNGYIVVGPDFIDTAPLSYTDPIAFSTIKGGGSRPLQVLQAAKRWVADMNADRDFFLSYLAEHRLDHISFVIDEMVMANNNSSSFFYRTIKEDAIGVLGHSEGGVALEGKIGAHPNAGFADRRIKSALLFSAPAYPFEETIKNIHIPVMLMAGDDDSPALGPGIPRRKIYDETGAPKYYLVLKNANHFSFSNPARSFLRRQDNSANIDSIKKYGLAFFDAHLGQNGASKTLGQYDPAWAYYAKEEKSGEKMEWGKEPPQSPAGSSPLGIGRERLQGGLMRKLLQRIWR